MYPFFFFDICFPSLFSVVYFEFAFHVPRLELDWKLVPRILVQLSQPIKLVKRLWYVLFALFIFSTETNARQWVINVNEFLFSLCLNCLLGHAALSISNSLMRYFCSHCFKKRDAYETCFQPKSCCCSRSHPNLSLEVSHLTRVLNVG